MALSSVRWIDISVIFLSELNLLSMVVSVAGGTVIVILPGKGNFLIYFELSS